MVCLGETKDAVIEIYTEVRAAPAWGETPSENPDAIKVKQEEQTS